MTRRTRVAARRACDHNDHRRHGDGFLDAFDTSTGPPLLRHPLSVDAQAPLASVTSGGVAIADHTVLAATSTATGDGVLVAYRLPG